MKVIFTIILLLFCITTHGQIRMPEIFSDNCVLQHNSNVKIWGWADKNANVSVTGSWDNKTVTVSSDSDGKWMAQLTTPDASDINYTITINQTDVPNYTIKDVAIGDVWFCAGQSNMEMPVRGWLPECPIDHSESLIAQSGAFSNRIRCAMVERAESGFPLKESHGRWEKASPETTPSFSATAYCFAMFLSLRLDHPVGIIVSAWGGSRIEQWMPQTCNKKYGYKTYVPQNERKWGTPNLIYNAMVYPLLNYDCKGFIWFQGENNIGDSLYAKKQKDLIEAWRTAWGLGPLPFYMVEITPYNYNANNAADLKACQLKAAMETDNCGLVGTNDLVNGDAIGHNIHGGNKLEIGYRLANFAKPLYNRDPWGPVFKSMRCEDNKAIISFSHNECGFIDNPNITGFEVAGEDLIFHPAIAEVVNGKDVEVSSPKVKKVVAVNYCWGNAKVGNLLNKSGLPVFAFNAKQ